MSISVLVLVHATEHDNLLLQSYLMMQQTQAVGMEACCWRVQDLSLLQVPKQSV